MWMVSCFLEGTWACRGGWVVDRHLVPPSLAWQYSCVKDPIWRSFGPLLRYVVDKPRTLPWVLIETMLPTREIGGRSCCNLLGIALTRRRCHVRAVSTSGLNSIALLLELLECRVFQTSWTTTQHRRTGILYVSITSDCSYLRHSVSLGIHSFAFTLDKRSRSHMCISRRISSVSRRPFHVLQVDHVVQPSAYD